MGPGRIIGLSQFKSRLHSALLGQNAAEYFMNGFVAALSRSGRIHLSSGLGQSWRECALAVTALQTGGAAWPTPACYVIPYAVHHGKEGV